MLLWRRNRVSFLPYSGVLFPCPRCLLTSLPYPKIHHDRSSPDPSIPGLNSSVRIGSASTESGSSRSIPKAEIKSAKENQQERKTSWGYGSDPKSPEDLLQRFKAVCDVLLDNPYMFGYCYTQYTQLTDIFPEENGIYDFDRNPKFDIDRIREIQQRPAAIEESDG
ncbi:MAG: hypothetical protein KY468_13360 [Armatimonadetes bacterium]|nr:hypothetical protein [Armatimonadota bacterium]